MCKPLCVRVCVHAMTFHVCTSAFGMCYAKKDVRQVHDMSCNQCQLCITSRLFLSRKNSTLSYYLLLSAVEGDGGEGQNILTTW